MSTYTCGIHKSEWGNENQSRNTPRHWAADVRQCLFIRKPTGMSPIQRHGVTRRWSDAVVHNGVLHFVEIADDPSADMLGQVQQILAQIDSRLALVGSDRTRLLQVLIYVTDLANTPILNQLWDEWVPDGHAPARACVQVGLGTGYLIEMVITAATG